jgi:hyperosmotically inducible protein
MRVPLLTLLSITLVIGCADRDSRTARRDITTDPAASTDTATDTPRTTADQVTPGAPGAISDEGRAEMRREQRVKKPVIGDPGYEIDKDNTALNKRDADTHLTKTPRDQGENEKDLQTTAAIRKRVTDTKISITGQNVKIITSDGKVTLRGPVKTEDEKQMIERIAIEIAGDGNVENQLEVERE